MNSTPSRSGRPLTLAHGFKPEQLARAADPLPGAQSWQWLIERTAMERKEYLSTFVKGCGTTVSTDREVAKESRSTDELIAGHLHQQVYLELPGGALVLLQPAAGVGAADSGHDRNDPAGLSQSVPEPSGPGLDRRDFPFEGPVAVIGTSVPAEVAVEAVGAVVADELYDYVVGTGLPCLTATAADPGREWVDDVIVVAAEYPTSIITTSVAASFWQRFLTVWRPDAAHPFGVLEVVAVTGPDAISVVAAAPADLKRMDARPCPLIPDAVPGELCRTHGGPWVSRSIRATANWERRRARLIRAMGCDTCGGGAIKIFQESVVSGSRAALTVRPNPSIPTRYDRVVGCDQPPPTR